MQATCQVCGSSEWWDLPNPADERSVTTAGRVINESLGKAQCANCGFVQRIHAQFLGLTDYYEQDYAKYYDRPGTAQFHAARYRVLAEWMVSVLQPRTPSRILDVGCGQGWAMEAMKALFPQAVVEGLEPSTFNSQVARDKGFVVYTSRAGEAALPETKYDLVYSNNVIQHVTNAREFVTSLKEMVSEDGVILVSCPDGSEPNIEILWADQNFSFIATHLIKLCKDVGFETVIWFSSPPSPSVPPAQMLLLSKDDQLQREHIDMAVPASSLGDIYQSKCDYLNSFKEIDEHLCSVTERCANIYNFGASYWSSILAAYCPRYWQRVSACLVDNSDSIERGFLDKEVLPLSLITPTADDAIVFGTSPSTHKVLKPKFLSSWKHVVSWDGFSPQY